MRALDLALVGFEFQLCASLNLLNGIYLISRNILLGTGKAA